jgi:hypothetical protein
MKNTTLILAIILCDIVLLHPGEAHEPPAPEHPRYTLAQEQLILPGGVLVSRPNPTDEQILNFLRQHRVHTVEAYARWLSENTIYQKDQPKDEWRQPLDMLAQRAGDCEDFTLLNIAVLKVLGYQPRFLTLRQGSKAHAVCLFQHKGTYHWFDNHRLQNTSFTLLEDVLRYFHRHGHYASIDEMSAKSIPSPLGHKPRDPDNEK